MYRLMLCLICVAPCALSSDVNAHQPIPSLMWLQTVALELLSAYQCHPVFLGKELKEEYYKGMGRFSFLHQNFHAADHCCCLMVVADHADQCWPTARRLLQTAALAAVSLPHTALSIQLWAI